MDQTGQRAGARRDQLQQQWASIPLAAPQLVTYKSADGVEIEAALLVPDRAAGVLDPAGRHPPPLSRGQLWCRARRSHRRLARTFEAWGQLLAAPATRCSIRTSADRPATATTSCDQNRADWGGGDFKDVMAGLDGLVARRIADPARLGIGGWSYGGYMASWAITQTPRFKAAVSGAGMSDLATSSAPRTTPRTTSGSTGCRTRSPTASAAARR